MTHYYARSEEALRNGSFIKVRTFKKKSPDTVCYVNGDYMGEWKGSSDPIAEWPRWEEKDARKLLPKAIR